MSPSPELADLGAPAPSAPPACPGVARVRRRSTAPVRQSQYRGGVLTKGDLTGADLRRIRQSALGAADPLGVAAELAEAVDAGRLADREDAGLALVLAAEIAESRTKLDAALRYVERAVDAYATRDDSEAGAARALRARRGRDAAR